MLIKDYNRTKAVEYAHKWAYLRNPAYYNFDAVGGDCTNFVSQCLYEGCHIMNYNQYGWFYINGNEKSPSWSGVEFLHKFLTKNNNLGPFGNEVPIEQIVIGDIIQLSFDGDHYTHTVIVVKTTPKILISCHTYDSDYRDIHSYLFQKMRCIHIEGIRISS